MDWELTGIVTGLVAIIVILALMPKKKKKNVEIHFPNGFHYDLEDKIAFMVVTDHVTECGYICYGGSVGWISKIKWEDGTINSRTDKDKLEAVVYDEYTRQSAQHTNESNKKL